MRAARILALVMLPVFLAGCGSKAVDTVTSLLPIESENVRMVKGGTVKACPLSTLGEMADAFFSDPEWTDFESVSGEQVVEVTGGMSYDGMPTQARIQFTVEPLTGSFEVGYLEIGGEGQSILVTSVLLNKMCEAV